MSHLIFIMRSLMSTNDPANLLNVPPHINQWATTFSKMSQHILNNEPPQINQWATTNKSMSHHTFYIEPQFLFFCLVYKTAMTFPINSVLRNMFASNPTEEEKFRLYSTWKTLQRAENISISQSFWFKRLMLLSFFVTEKNYVIFHTRLQHCSAVYSECYTKQIH
jgi:hypothetical protein